MNIFTRIVLIVGAIGIMAYFLYKIRKKRIHIQYAIYWTFFAGVIVFISIFPNVVEFFSDLIGIEIPVHFLISAILGLMLLKLFGDTVKISDLEKKMEVLTHELALMKKKYSDKKN